MKDDHCRSFATMTRVVGQWSPLVVKMTHSSWISLTTFIRRSACPLTLFSTKCLLCRSFSLRFQNLFQFERQFDCFKSWEYWEGPKLGWRVEFWHRELQWQLWPVSNMRKGCHSRQGETGSLMPGRAQAGLRQSWSVQGTAQGDASIFLLEGN